MRLGQQVPLTFTATLLRDPSGNPRAVARPAYLLKVLRGPDARQQRRFAQERTLVGSAEGAQFRLTDPTVSAIHCELKVDATGLRVRDLGSKNGVLLDGRRTVEAWLKPTDELTLGSSVLRFKLLDEQVEEPLAARTTLGGLSGRSVRMRQLFAELELAAKSEAAVLLSGETGTGKELAAEALVATGPRRRAPLVVVSCASLEGALVESELFGHEKGAFTGAVASRAGVFELARGGTVLLDEVGELPLQVQPKLLGVLERRVVRRVGGQQAIPLDARVIATTQRDLATDVNRGRFRPDLYYRLTGIEIRVPSLNERREDIPELVARFLEELPGKHRLAPDLLERLYGADYPGNVRELRAAVERAVLGLGVVGQGVPHRGGVELELPFRVQKERFLAGFEREYLRALLDETKGNVSEASRRSGISRVHLHELLRKVGVTRV
jgi:two-component system response regulator GlrR